MHKPTRIHTPKESNRVLLISSRQKISQISQLAHIKHVDLKGYKAGREDMINAIICAQEILLSRHFGQEVMGFKERLTGREIIKSKTNTTGLCQGSRATVLKTKLSSYSHCFTQHQTG